MDNMNDNPQVPGASLPSGSGAPGQFGNGTAPLSVNTSLSGGGPQGGYSSEQSNSASMPPSAPYPAHS